ncbi:hypothetical protein C2G38_2158582 [Gigaspora rosea]|uniref:Uncharacterized protein n=1 Tax=Gigaspora rosea TaxID=44941 RepID=A0A397W9I4_9GLOM|nr:hypothetical protein C2G38_2158582 [Gigaspora rosea]
MKNKKKQNKQNETSEREIPSLTSLSTSSSLLSASLKKKTIEYLDSESYERIKKEVFIWCDSALKDIYFDKKYNVSQQKLLKMLYGRWCAHYREFNIRKQGDEQVENNRRRKAKNSIVKDKKQRKVKAVDYLLAMKDPHIMKYPQSDLVAILKDSGYHSEEWEETDSKDDNYKKKPSIYIYNKWWRSKAVSKSSTIVIVGLTNSYMQTCFPPFGAPTWCLTNEALKKLNFPIENILIYDSEESNEGNNNNEDDNNNDSEDNSNTSKNTKGKEKESKKQSIRKKKKRRNQRNIEKNTKNIISDSSWVLFLIG